MFERVQQHPNMRPVVEQSDRFYDASRVILENLLKTQAESLEANGSPLHIVGEQISQ